MFFCPIFVDEPLIIPCISKALGRSLTYLFVPIEEFLKKTFLKSEALLDPDCGTSSSVLAGITALALQSFNLEKACIKDPIQSVLWRCRKIFWKLKI